MKVAYFNGQRLNVKDYVGAFHEGQVKCADGHFLVAKKGAIRVHHFSHRAQEGGLECSGDGKTDWHIWWQDRLLDRHIEFRFLKDGQLKIADSIAVIGPNRDILSIVEFQNSVMTANEMAFREAFYQRKDLMSEWGVPYCRASLTWIFNLDKCDISIKHIFGDLICFSWEKGSKYMMASTTRTFYDCNKKELILILAKHKTETASPFFIGRLIPFSMFDFSFFPDALDMGVATSREGSRSNLLSMVNEYTPFNVPLLESEEKLKPLVLLLKSWYFGRKKEQSQGSLILGKIRDYVSLFTTQ